MAAARALCLRDPRRPGERHLPHRPQHPDGLRAQQRAGQVERRGEHQQHELVGLRGHRRLLDGRLRLPPDLRDHCVHLRRGGAHEARTGNVKIS